MVRAAWQREKIVPAGRAGDAAFLRRIYLDLLGTIPSLDETRRFLGNAEPDKREKLIDRLLADARFAVQQANVWDLVLFGRNPPNLDGTRRRESFKKWLTDKFARNEPYDRWGRDLLLAEQDGTELFYVQYRNQPEDAAVAVSRVFLGIQLQCARCHDHPFESWTQRDFYGMAGFFVRLAVLDKPAAKGMKRFAIGEKSTGEVLFSGAVKEQKPSRKGEPVPANFLGSAALDEPPLPSFTEPYVNAEAEQRRDNLLRFLEDGFGREHPAEPFESHRLAKERSWRLLRVRNVFDIRKEWPAHRERYGDTNFGRGCFLARKLVESGVPFVEVGQDNYDSHADNFVCHKANMHVLDPAWSSLLHDLAERGLLQDTLVVWIGEVGRTPYINNRAGRDHYIRCWTVVLAAPLHAEERKSEPVSPKDGVIRLFNGKDLTGLRRLLHQGPPPVPQRRGLRPRFRRDRPLPTARSGGVHRPGHAAVLREHLRSGGSPPVRSGRHRCPCQAGARVPGSGRRGPANTEINSGGRAALSARSSTTNTRSDIECSTVPLRSISAPKVPAHE